MDYKTYVGAIRRSSYKQGVMQEREAIVTAMIKNKVSMEDISKNCNLPISEVKEIAAKYNFQDGINAK